MATRNLVTLPCDFSSSGHLKTTGTHSLTSHSSICEHRGRGGPTSQTEPESNAQALSCPHHRPPRAPTRWPHQPPCRQGPPRCLPLRSLALRERGCERSPASSPAPPFLPAPWQPWAASLCRQHLRGCSEQPQGRRASCQQRLGARGEEQNFLRPPQAGPVQSLAKQWLPLRAALKRVFLKFSLPLTFSLINNFLRLQTPAGKLTPRVVV